MSTEVRSVLVLSPTCVLTRVARTPADKSPTTTTTIIKITVITVTVLVTIVAMRYVNSKIDGVKHRVIYARRKARQAKVSGSGSGFGADSSWSTFPQDDAEAQASTPFIPLGQRDSMDVVHPETSTPRAYASPFNGSASSPPASRGNEDRYDDPYGGEGVDLAARRTSPRSPAPGASGRS